jgi:hypothetical protein
MRRRDPGGVVRIAVIRPASGCCLSGEEQASPGVGEEVLVALRAPAALADEFGRSGPVDV